MNAEARGCDVRLFEQQLAAGNAAQARALYAGELMPGFFDEWIVLERHRLEAQHDALPPALTAHGRGWRDELPGHAGGRLPVRSPDRLPARLPAYWTQAFGPLAALQTLARQVCTNRLISLVGPGGQGKARLAVAVAQMLDRQQPPPFDDLRFAPLADAVDEPSPWAALAAALPEASAGEPSRQVLAWVGQRRTLLVLDNLAQHDDHAGTALHGLLQRCRGVHLLLTSRRRLNLDGEQLVDMPGLALPDPVNPDLQPEDLARQPALALFVDRARQSRPEFQLRAQNLAAVVDLLRLLGGLPLAIELAAARLRALAPAELLQRLQEDAGSPLLDLLARPGSAQTRHASMRQVVAWSWRQLQPEAAMLLRAMSVFAVPASAQAITQALAVAMRSEWNWGPSLPAIQALMAWALDQQPGAGGTACRSGRGQRDRLAQPGAGFVDPLLGAPAAWRRTGQRAARTGQGAGAGRGRQQQADAGAGAAAEGGAPGLPLPATGGRRTAVPRMRSPF